MKILGVSTFMLAALVSFTSSQSISQQVKKIGKIQGFVNIQSADYSQITFLKEQNKVQGEKILQLQQIIKKNKQQQESLFEDLKQQFFLKLQEKQQQRLNEIQQLKKNMKEFEEKLNKQEETIIKIDSRVNIIDNQLSRAARTAQQNRLNIQGFRHGRFY